MRTRSWRTGRHLAAPASPLESNVRWLAVVALAVAFGCSDTPPEEGTSGDVVADVQTDAGIDAAPADTGADNACKPGEPCDDDNACSKNDKCNAEGKCRGEPVDCDDNNPCTKDRCDPVDGCSNPAKLGIDCTDGDPCTVGDACEDGKCAPGKKVSCPDGAACETLSCDPKDGGCTVKTAAADGAKCDTGHPCLVNGACKKGGSGESVCEAEIKGCDDENPCTHDACSDDGSCSHDGSKLDGQGCTDGDACTDNDQCDGKGACKAGAKKDCDDDNPCTDDSCDSGSKDKAGKGCQHKAAETKACDDGNLCTKDDACDSSGKCVGGENSCSCLKHKDCAKSEDGDLCNGTLICDIDTNKCVVDLATQVSCTDSGPCQAATCDKKTGKCGSVAKPDGGACNDSNACTKDDACKAGLCAGAAIDCDDGSVCTKDSCQPATGCAHVAAAGPCDADGDACTEDDACFKGVCVPGKAKACDDGNTCTIDSCDQASGTCKTAPGKDGAACDADGDACTVKDSCGGGKCLPGKFAHCGDGNPCTDDTCHPLKGCLNTANEAPCDDGDVCTKLDLCAAGKCTAGQKEKCDDNNECTADSCDNKKGCQHAAITGCVPKPKTWTVLVYMAADNNLEGAALKDIEEMLQTKQADTGDNLRFVVQIDRSAGFSAKPISGAGDFSSTQRLVIQAGKNGKRELIKVADLGETDTGDPKHLAEFIGWAASTYKSDYYALVMWNHGQAWAGIAGDEGSGEAKWLLLPELRKAIQDGLGKAGLTKLSLVGFDACLMGGLVVAKAVNGLADFMLASEDLEPGHGWDYRAFGAVVGNPKSGPKQLGDAVLQGYLNQAKNKKKVASITLAAGSRLHGQGRWRCDGAEQGAGRRHGEDRQEDRGDAVDGDGVWPLAQPPRGLFHGGSRGSRDDAHQRSTAGRPAQGPAAAGARGHGGGEGRGAGDQAGDGAGDLLPADQEALPQRVRGDGRHRPVAQDADGLSRHGQEARRRAEAAEGR